MLFRKKKEVLDIFIILGKNFKKSTKSGAVEARDASQGIINREMNEVFRKGEIMISKIEKLLSFLKDNNLTVSVAYHGYDVVGVKVTPSDDRNNFCFIFDSGSEELEGEYKTEIRDPRKVMVIFGGQDPEEQAARRIAREAGCVLATAVTADGKKVHAGNAYQATGYVVDEGDLAGVTGVVIFECAKAVAGELSVVAHCDHHNPGDAGYGLPAAEYWRASSLGQLCAALGTEPTDELRMVAAGDHCPADAYAGCCPGVDPVAFGLARIAGKVAFYATNPRTADKADPEKIRAAIEAAKSRLLAAPEVDGVRDLRDAGEVDELPEAALASGLAYMAAIPDTDRDRQPTGNTKIVLGGHTTPETVEKFLGWARSLKNRVGEPYGNPIRGFAGVVVKP